MRRGGPYTLADLDQGGRHFSFLNAVIPERFF